MSSRSGKSKKGKKQNKNNYYAGKSGLRPFGELAVFFYTAYMAVVFPLVFHNNYIDITITKYNFFWKPAVVFIAVMAAYEIYIRVTGKRKSEGKRDKGITVILIFAAVFAVSLIISTAASAWPDAAFSGEFGRRMGTFTWLLCIAVCFFISLRGRVEKTLAIVFAAGSAAAIFLGIMNFLGFDPLGMYSNLIAEHHSMFIGTIGNRNVVSGWLCMTMPALFACFYAEKNRKLRVFFAIIAAAAVYEGFAAESDGFILGLAGTVLVFLFVSLKDPDRMGKFWQICFIMFAAACLIRITVLSAAAAGHVSPFLEAFPDGGAIGTMTKPVFLVISGAVLFLLALFERRFVAKRFRGSYPFIRRLFFIALFILIAVFVVMLIAANTAPEAVEGTLLEKLVIQDAFGSNRGYIWKRSLELYSEAPFKDKIFGVGTDCFYNVAYPAFGNEMVARYGAPFVDAHCELLQMLVTTGLAGVIGYFGMFISSIVYFIRRAGRSHAALCGAAVLMSFVFQGTVNNPVIHITPLIFVFAGAAMSGARETEIAEGRTKL